MDMKNTWQWSIENDRKYTRYGFRVFKVYWAYRDWLVKRRNEEDWKSSFVGKFIDNDFKTHNGKEVDLNGWCGVNRYHPDVSLIKGDKKVIISLGGSFTLYNSDYWELFKSTATKYICMVDGKNVIYETWTGELPSNEVVNKFIYE